jgi:hypothetical protein
VRFRRNWPVIDRPQLVQEDPVPYRFSLGAGLMAAAYLRILLAPESNCLMAYAVHPVLPLQGLAGRRGK